MNRKILIVDDEPEIRMLMRRILEDLEDFEDLQDTPIKLMMAADGEEALNMIKTEKPDLVFLDVRMPRMNGFDVCHFAKNDLKLQEVYIVLLTAQGQESDLKTGQVVGADFYMTKPFDPMDILNKAHEVLQKVSL